MFALCKNMKTVVHVCAEPSWLDIYVLQLDALAADLFFKINLLSGLIWVQTICKHYQQITLVDKEQNMVQKFVPICQMCFLQLKHAPTLLDDHR